MAWISRIRYSCPRGTRTKKFVGPTSGEALRKGINFDPGPGCKKVGAIEMIRKGPKRKGRR
jgi:hypothetical protein